MSPDALRNALIFVLIAFAAVCLIAIVLRRGKAAPVLGEAPDWREAAEHARAVAAWHRAEAAAVRRDIAQVQLTIQRARIDRNDAMRREADAAVRRRELARQRRGGSYRTLVG